MPTLKINSISIDLPFKPYPAQLITMSKIISALLNKQSALIESPTGTGKTFSILCSLLAYKKATNDVSKIYICSRTHKQIDQMIDQLKKTKYSPKIAILASRSQLCINPLLKDESDKNKACNDLVKKNMCSFFKNKDKIQQKIMDIEELRRDGKRCCGCPFYASRIMEEKAEVVFAPYNYIVDPAIRNAMNIELKNAIVVIDEAHNIEDFCRSAGSVKLEKTVLLYMVDEILGVLKRGLISNEMKKDFLLILEIIRKLTEFGEGKIKDDEEGWLSIDKKDKIYQNIEEGCLSIDKKEDIFLYQNKENLLNLNEKISSSFNKENSQKESLLNFYKKKSMENTKNTSKIFKGNEILQVLELLKIDKLKYVKFKTALNNTILIEEMKDFLSSNTKNTLESFVMILDTVFFGNLNSYVFSYKKEMNNYELNFWLMDSSVIFLPIVQSVKSIILLSGTLTPFKTFSSELGHSFGSATEAPHIVNKKNVFVACLEKGHLGKEIIGTFKNTESFEYLDQIKDAIINIREKVKLKGGTLVFVPSYLFLENLMKRFSKTKHIFVEPKNGSKFEGIFLKYKKSIERKEGGILFCVYRGRASEGMDFKDNFARAVIAIGIPFPMFMDAEVVCKREYNDKFKEMKGGVWYEIQAYRAVNQAIGRVLRHKDDWGGVFLIDARYTEKRSFEYLPKWVKENFKGYVNCKECFVDFENFVDNKI
ncbi:hypothetical protein GVAV_001531 [Gurleya vavrai]